MGESPSQLMEARPIIEGELVVLACARISDSVLGKLRDLLKSMATDIERRRARVDLDRQFHVTLTDVTGKAVLVRLVGELESDPNTPPDS